ncbi:glycosyltransferase family protein [Rhodococcoides yunnanense]|uniref:glycosyltransferase family protein n=1 Tax=Rhodococcoides yunnanense TaxID=278209 RepID=UPI0009327159|nr:glycosyltransferase [Rhodococcus yunnanensis]
MQTPTVTVVYMSGRNTGGVDYPDAPLIEALSTFVHVLWIDSATGEGEPSGPDLQRIRHNLTRVRTSAPAAEQSIASALDRLGADAAAVILSDPMARFPRALTGHRLFYMTEDWVLGAKKYGLSRRAVRRGIEINCARADTIAAVSHTLAARLHLYSKVIDAVRVVPPGCSPVDNLDKHGAYDEHGGDSVALVGPLDERLDFDILDAVADSGRHILAEGSRTIRTPQATTARLDAFLARPNVRLVDAAAAESPIAAASVGIVPYVLDALDLARFPSQTLEYLAFGIPVVATDIPAVRWVDSEHVTIASSPAEFARRVTEIGSAVQTSAHRVERRSIASKHTWAARAETMLRLAGLSRCARAAQSTVPATEAEHRR